MPGLGPMREPATTNSVSREPQLPQRQRSRTSGVSPRPPSTSAARSASLAWWQDRHHTCSRRPVGAIERGVGSSLVIAACIPRDPISAESRQQFRGSQPTARAPRRVWGCGSPARPIRYRAGVKFNMARIWGGGVPRAGGWSQRPAAGAVATVGPAGASSSTEPMREVSISYVVRPRLTMRVSVKV